MLDLVRFGANVLEEAVRAPRLVRFGAFEVDLRAGELRKDGTRLKLTGQPFQVLTILLEQPGEVVTREELQKRLWPDTFVDVDHNLNTAINKIREVLADSAESPRYVETLPRRGYRFITPLDSEGNGSKPAAITTTESPSPRRRRILNASLLLSALTLLAGGRFLAYKGTHAPASPRQRTLTRVTFGDGLEIGADVVAGWALHCLQLRSRRKIRHLGAAGQRWRSGSSHQGAGKQLAAGLVSRR